MYSTNTETHALSPTCSSPHSGVGPFSWALASAVRLGATDAHMNTYTAPHPPTPCSRLGRVVFLACSKQRVGLSPNTGLLFCFLLCHAPHSVTVYPLKGSSQDRLPASFRCLLFHLSWFLSHWSLPPLWSFRLLFFIPYFNRWSRLLSIRHLCKSLWVYILCKCYRKSKFIWLIDMERKHGPCQEMTAGSSFQESKLCWINSLYF